jgi:hypothetical protein
MLAVLVPVAMAVGMPMAVTTRVPAPDLMMRGGSGVVRARMRPRAGGHRR